MSKQIRGAAAVLQEAITEIKELVIKANRHDVLARRQIAVKCLEIRESDGGKYGEEAVVKLAQALGWSKSNVNNYAVVAKTWPDEDEFSALAARADKFGKPLSWSHFVLIANVKSVKQRQELIRDALKHGWSFRELKAELPSEVSPAETPQSNPLCTVVADRNVDEVSPTETPQSNPLCTVAAAENADEVFPVETPRSNPPPTLVAAAKNYATQVAALKRNAMTFGKHLIEEVRNADPADISKNFLNLVKQTRQDFSEMLDQHDELLAQTEERRTALARPQDDRGAPVADQPENQSQKHRGEVLVGVQ